MGTTKRKREKLDEADSNAKHILLSIGEIKLCECGNYFYRVYKYDEKAIYALSTVLFKQKYGERQGYELLREAVKKILQEAGDGKDCPYCNKD